ncbi:MAG: heme o synthase [Planctomycetota bacterium]
MTRTSPITIRAVTEAERDAAASNAWIELAKPGITRLVALTAAGGFALRAASTPGEGLLAQLLPFIGCVAGVALASAGGNALNQWYEADIDRAMPRTRRRPIPSGRVSPAGAFKFGVATSIAGVLAMLAAAGPVAAALTLASVALYVLIYTPWKRWSWTCTLVGAIPGALPPMIGVVAASRSSGFEPLLDPLGLTLFGLLFVWQLPHFLAIAAMYKDDYAAGGIKVLPTVAGLRINHTAMVATAALLVPAAVAPAFSTDLLGWPYAVFAALTTIAFVFACSRANPKRDARKAWRTVFFGSIIHLPLLIGAAVIESAIRFALAP